MAVSATLSPFAAELVPAPVTLSTLPPSSYMAASKLSRVRVLGSKNRVASFFPWQASLYFSGRAIISSAVSISASSSSGVRSGTSITLRIMVSLLLR